MLLGVMAKWPRLWRRHAHARLCACVWVHARVCVSVGKGLGVGWVGERVGWWIGGLMG